MWIKYASLALATLIISGCSLLGSKPSLQDRALDHSQPIPEALTQAYNQGLLLLEKEQYQEAQAQWQDTAEQWPNYPGIWSNLALSQWHLEQYQAGLDSNKKALELNADFCPANKVQALLEKEIGEFETAIQYYERAGKCAPEDADIPYNIGIIYDLYIKDLKQALTYYNQAQEMLNEENETLAMWIADLQNRQPKRIAGEAE